MVNRYNTYHQYQYIANFLFKNQDGSEILNLQSTFFPQISFRSSTYNCVQCIQEITETNQLGIKTLEFIKLTTSILVFKTSILHGAA
jgi:hypothetical protein